MKVQEHADHFVVDDGKGKPFKVAKAHLHHGTVQKIQKFAEGGVVQPDPTEEIPFSQAVSQGFAPIKDAISSLYAPSNAPPPDTSPAPSVGPPELLAAPAPDAPAAPLPAPAAAPLKLPGAPPELARGAAQEIQGINARAGVAGAQGREDAATADNLATGLQQAQQRAQQQLATNQADQERMFNDIQSSKIDPNRIWKDASGNRDTGKVVSSSIALILGGIGAGLTRGPNYALQTIDKAIDRDVEAQKLELGKKENLLSHYMQQGHSIMAASAMVKSDLLNTAAAQLQKTSATYQGQKAAADAQIAVGQLRSNVALEQQKASAMALENEQRKLGLLQSRQSMEAMRQLLKGVTGGGGFDRRMLEMPGFEKYRERAVDLPDGSVAFAPDKEEANKSREGFAAVSTLKSKLQRFSALAKNGNPATTDRGTAQAMRADILAEMGHLHGLQRLTDTDLELFKKQVPEISDLIKPMAGQKLKALGQSIDDKVWSLQQNYLNRPGKRPGG